MKITESYRPKQHSTILVVLFVIALGLAIAACGGSKGMNRDPLHSSARSVFVDGGNVYVVGFIAERHFDNPATSIWQATIWKNGVPHALESNGISMAYSVCVYGGDVYVAGDDGPNAVLWKNNERQGLTNTNNGGKAQAKSVFVSNGDVYVVGHENNIAIVWKNGEVQHLTDGSKKSAANSVYVYEGDVYVAGNDGTKAVLWKNGVDQEYPAPPPGYRGNYNIIAINSVFVSNGDVYATGSCDQVSYSSIGSTMYRGLQRQTIWINGEPHFSGGRESEISDVANSVFVANSGEFIVSGHVINFWPYGYNKWPVGASMDATVWGGNKQNPNTFSLSLTTDKWAQAHSVFLSGKDQYVVGDEYFNIFTGVSDLPGVRYGYSRAVLWKNGIEQKLQY